MRMPRGEASLIEDPTGAGKSSLLRSMAGFGRSAAAKPRSAKGESSSSRNGLICRSAPLPAHCSTHAAINAVSRRPDSLQCSQRLDSARSRTNWI